MKKYIQVIREKVSWIDGVLIAFPLWVLAYSIWG